MYKNLRWKVVTILTVFVVFFSIGVYPLLSEHYHWPCPSWLKAKQLKLGLDLKGGVHLVLKVNTDDALRISTTAISEQLRDSLKNAGINIAAITAPSPTTFRVEGVPQDKDAAFRTAADEIAPTNYDRNPLPGGAYEFKMKPNIERDLREQAVEQAMQTIDRRVNELGVAEPSIARQPSGEDLRVAKPGLDENNQPAVHFELKSAGAAKFGKLSGENLGRYLAIILDNKVVSAPKLEGRITDQGRISGGFTAESANDLSLTLRSGALPASLTYLEEQVVGPSLGADSIRAGIVSSVVGLLLIMLFMLFYYRLSGINAIVALLFNLVILLGLMAYFGATMTLPGIAGFVLTMGVGVDSNVLIFERIKEELAAPPGVRAAINAGFSRVFLTLLDTHVASLIAAMFLFQFGTGPIRRFPLTLSIDLLPTLFTPIFFSHTLS